MEQEALAVRVAQLQAANNYLTRANLVKPRVRIVLQARASADLLALWHLAGFRTGRIAAYQMGMSDRRWHYGRALLQVARVYDTEWLTDSPVAIENALSVATKRCVENPDVLLLRLPMSRQLR